MVRTYSVVLTLRAGGDGYNIRGYHAYDSSLGNAIHDNTRYVVLKLYPRRTTFS